MLKLKDVNALMTGLFLVAVATLAFWLTARLSTFTQIGLGSGFLPRLFAVILVCFGAALITVAYRSDPADEPMPWNFRSWAVLASIAFFGMTIEDMGLVISITGLVMISSFAHAGSRLRETLPLAAGSVIFCWLVFVKALGLTIPLWPDGF